MIPESDVLEMMQNGSKIYQFVKSSYSTPNSKGFKVLKNKCKIVDFEKRYKLTPILGIS